MKKFICAAVLASAMIFPAGTMSFARTGDVVGHIYSTDIRAYIDDIEVSSYNIGGKTVIILEDVLKYKAYDDYSRTLTITEIGGGNVISGRAERYSTSGIEIGNIYETDIKTYICGKQVTAYNIGGKTAVALEDLGGYNSYSDIGCKYNWDNSTRTIRFETRITIEDDYGNDYDWHSIWESDDDDDDSWYDDDQTTYGSERLSNLTNIGEGWGETNELTDNYGNRYSYALRSNGAERKDLVYGHGNYLGQYILNGKYDRLSGTLYVCKGETNEDSTGFVITLDGKTIYTSPEITKMSRPIDIDVSVKGGNVLEIENTGDTWFSVFLGEAELY